MPPLLLLGWWQFAVGPVHQLVGGGLQQNEPPRVAVGSSSFHADQRKKKSKKSEADVASTPLSLGSCRKFLQTFRRAWLSANFAKHSESPGNIRASSREFAAFEELSGCVNQSSWSRHAVPVPNAPSLAARFPGRVRASLLDMRFQWSDCSRDQRTIGATDTESMFET